MSPFHRAGTVLAAFASLSLAAAAHAGVNGFNNGVGFTTNTNVPGLSVISGNTATLSDQSGGFQATSLFFNTPQDITHFTVAFTYQAGGDRAGDGFAFVLQNDPRGSSTVGSGGGYLGYGGTGLITNSAAIEFNLYSPYGQGMRLGTNGITGVFGDNGGYQATTPLDFSSGDAINVQLTYDGTTLAESLTDPAANTTYSTSYTVDLVGVTGASNAFVGFTGGDASARSVQTLSDFQYNPPAVPEASTVASLGLLLTLGGVVVVAGRRGRKAKNAH